MDLTPEEQSAGPVDFSRIGEAKLSLVPANVSSGSSQSGDHCSLITSVFATSYNILRMYAAIGSIKDAVEDHVINESIYDDPKWQALGLPSVHKTDDIYDNHRYYEVQLPVGWTITGADSNIIFSKDGVEVYRKAPFARLEYSD